MKKIILLISIFFSFLNLFAQQQGISYQALIVDQNPQEIPGLDISGNIPPNHPIIVRFTVLDAIGNVEYQEDQKTSTDKFGMINLTIGWGEKTTSSPKEFSEIDWNGKPKHLKVSISLSQTDVFFTDFSYQDLTFVPYAYHRNITATGTMIIDGVTTLNNRLNVANGSSTFLTGNLNVEQKTILKDELSVEAQSKMNGQVIITSDVKGEKDKMDTYPLIVKGSSQGIAVKVNGSRNGDNYFMSFWDKNKLQGRIEGQTVDELENDPAYKFTEYTNISHVAQATIDEVLAAAGVVSASTSSTACAGLGACVTAPIPSLIVQAIANAVVKTANLAEQSYIEYKFLTSKHDNIGITFQSGSGDYAEWLPKSDLTKSYSYGDIVSVKGGFITKNTDNAELVMVISHQAIVLGNMPQPGDEKNYEKVAFLGQVPVKVFGKVNPGDYIIPNGKNNGVGIAISPDDIKLEDTKKIVGIAWSANSELQYGYVNIAVGLKSNDVASLLTKQQDKIDKLQDKADCMQKQINNINKILTQLLPNYADSINIQPNIDTTDNKQKYVANTGNTDETIIYYHKITREEIILGIKEANEILSKKGINPESNQMMKKINTDAQYQKNFINNFLASIDLAFHKEYDEQIKNGAVVINF